MRAAAALAALLLVFGACKRSPSYSRSSPSATLDSFFKALEAGDLPEHLDSFVISGPEAARWRLRCGGVGCKGGHYRIVARGEQTEFRAVLYVDYSVEGNGGGRVMHGERSPIQFEREGDTWYIVQFGRQIQATRHPPPPDDAAPAPADDAGETAGGDAAPE